MTTEREEVIANALRRMGLHRGDAADGSCQTCAFKAEEIERAVAEWERTREPSAAEVDAAARALYGTASISETRPYETIDDTQREVLTTRARAALLAAYQVRTEGTT